MPNFDPGMSRCCDPLPSLSTGVGISGDEINYRGADLPLPKPFFQFVCVISLLPQFVVAAPKQFITLLLILGDGGMPGGAFSGTRCTKAFVHQPVSMPVD